MSLETGRRGGSRVQVEGVSVPIDHYIDGRRIASTDRFDVRSPIDWDNWELAAHVGVH